MITTTLKRVYKCHGWSDQWQRLIEPLVERDYDAQKKAERRKASVSYAKITRLCGLHIALWCTKSSPEHEKEWRLFAVWCAKRAKHLMLDQRSISALDVAERFAAGVATHEELAIARLDAYAASRSIDDWYLRDAARTAFLTTEVEAWRAAERSADAAGWAFWADAKYRAEAGGAMASDALVIANDAQKIEWKAQKAEFLRVVGGEVKQ